MERHQPPRTIFSFEVFPPKRDMPLDSIYQALGELAELQPSFRINTIGKVLSICPVSTSQKKKFWIRWNR